MEYFGYRLSEKMTCKQKKSFQRFQKYSNALVQTSSLMLQTHKVIQCKTMWNDNVTKQLLLDIAILADWKTKKRLKVCNYIAIFSYQD